MKKGMEEEKQGDRQKQGGKERNELGAALTNYL